MNKQLSCYTISCACMLIGMLSGTATAKDSTSPKLFTDGWNGLTTQIDPFDEQQTNVVMIFKTGFYLTCGVLNVAVSSTGFESYSLPASIKYVVDANTPVAKKGMYSTYHDGSDMVTDSRYYSFKLTPEDLDNMRVGGTLKVAGKTLSGGWETKSLDLTGFGTMYSKMCS